MLSSTPELTHLLLPPGIVFPSCRSGEERFVFVIDTLSLPMELVKAARTLRLRCPGCKLIALVRPETDDPDLLRLLYYGIDGILRMNDKLKVYLPEAVQAVQSGKLWAPNHLLTEFIRQSNLLIDKRFLSQVSMTGRESQVLHLLIRRLSNKEIAEALGISERTVRFHVSNVFAKLHVANRRNLIAAFGKLAQEYS